ncbi:hypothetical protein LINPERHAP1_LOCUS27742, partial [Linum perenne]
SYKGALAGVPPISPNAHKSWICVGENDIVPSIRNDIRTLQISKSLKDKLCKPWTNTAIIRLIGKSIGYNYLCHRLSSMWKPMGSLQIIDLNKNCYLVKFDNEQDDFKALTGGPWMIFDHYLVIQQWDPSFRVSDKLPSKMVVWARLPHLPILFYHPQILTALGNLIGRTVRIDFTTQNDERGKFARLAVEIDLDVPLAPVIDLDGAWQKVEYENIPDLCFECGLIGHNLGNCPKLTKAVYPITTDVPVQSSELTSVDGNGGAKNDAYGPWLVVSRKGRRQRLIEGSEKESLVGRKEPKTQEPKKQVNPPSAKSLGKSSQDSASLDSSKEPSISTPKDSAHGMKKTTAIIIPAKIGKSNKGNIPMGPNHKRADPISTGPSKDVGSGPSKYSKDGPKGQTSTDTNKAVVTTNATSSPFEGFSPPET